nr:MAG TPA: hypothetical protein [Bacteriophage sp.]
MLTFPYCHATGLLKNSAGVYPAKRTSCDIFFKI